MDLTLIVMWLGFGLAAYSVVGNDVIQTLGTFLTSNEKRVQWWVLWLYAGIILLFALVNGFFDPFGWYAIEEYTYGIAYGRLDKFAMPTEYPWFYLLPPVILLLLTRTGIPVSTTFMILTLFSLANVPGGIGEMTASIFDTDTVLGGMIKKSIFGYIIAFGSALVIYLAITRLTEKYFIENPIRDERVRPTYPLLAAIVFTGIALAVFTSLFTTGPASEDWLGYVIALAVGIGLPFAMSFLKQRVFWTTLQWFTTAFLWFQWLTQDLANIYIYLRGGEGLSTLGFWISVAILLGLLGFIFYIRGGAVQQVVREKTNTDDIRSATFVDAIYAFLLFFFKDDLFGIWGGKVAMSTTWIFIGLLAGRELGMRLNLYGKVDGVALKMIGKDLGKITLGLVVSVLLVFAIRLLSA